MDTNQEKAHVLFQATCVATAECDLSDIPTEPSQIPEDQSATYFPSPLSPFSRSSICDSLNATHPMKAPGPDHIQNWVWSLAWDVISGHVTLLFQAIATQGFIPPRWKIARTIMLAKPGKDDYTQPGSY